MLNKEKYAKEILDIICNTGETPAVVDGKPCNCKGTICEDCNFYNHPCCNEFKEWANSEYKEPEIDWTKVPVDTPIYVRDYENESWKKRYFAEYCNGKIYAYPCGATSWSFDPDDAKLSKWEEVKIAEEVDCSKWYED